MLITSKENPSVKEYIKLRDKSKYRRETGLFVLEGARITTDAVKENIDIKFAFITEEARLKYPEATGLLAERLGENLFDISGDISARISDTGGAQGIFLVAERLDKPISLNTINNGSKFVILNNLQDPGNVGTILRCADACGIDGVFLCGGCDLYNPKLIRSTMGSLFRLPVSTEYEYYQLLEKLASKGVLTYASVIDKDASSLRDFKFDGSCAVVIGNEGNGLSHEEAAACDGRITIKMNGNIDSLNAATAASIIMWELTK